MRPSASAVAPSVLRMSESVERFWIPVASVLPVFILALVIEARVALPRRTKKQRKQDSGQERWVQRTDFVASIVYGWIYFIAMLLLVFSFAAALGVLAGGELALDREALAIDNTYFTVLVGAAMTGLLPVARIAFDSAMDRFRPAEQVKGTRKS